jgi:four helix bundle protein
MNQPVTRFEDLVAWQNARMLTNQVYVVTGGGPFNKDFGLKDQMRRAAVSIMANVAEGFERSKRTEFHQFLSIAKGSCGELRSHLYVAADAGYLNTEEFAALSSQVTEFGRIIGGLRASVERLRDGK